LAVTSIPLAHRGYRLLLRGLTLPMLAWLWWRGRKDAGYRQHLGQRLGFTEPAPASVGGLLIHAASVGEVQAARPLIDALRSEWPVHTLTVSTHSPTGARQLRSHWGDAIQHVFFPFDTPGATARFLDRLQPQLVVLVERELWPELLLQCRQRSIPVALVNARLSEASAASYRRWQALMQPVWAQLALVATADTPTTERLRALGVPDERLLETGNLKFDQPVAPAGSQELRWLRGRPVIVAGSTHEGEEDALLAAWPAFAARHPGCVLILVPRHPERFDAVARLIDQTGLPCARRSRQEVPAPETGVFLADTMGELGLWYAHASVCFIGGSLAAIGGHNALEALACGKPVLFGPHTQHFQSLYQEIEAHGLGERVASARELLETAGRWLDEPARLADKGEQARHFVERQQGSSQRSLQALRPLWQPTQPGLLTQVLQQSLTNQTLWHDPAMLTQCSPRLFDPEEGATALATGSGRGQARRLQLEGQEVVLRHYRRGGMMARFSPDRYWRSRAPDSRAMGEYALLRRMRAWGLPVPAPVAARQLLSGLWYTADILVAMIPGTQNVAQRLSQAPLGDDEWRALGLAIRRLHDRQVIHSDLNCHNLLLDESRQAWIVDFDKCEVRTGETWKEQNLARLLRSLRKERIRRSPFYWDETHWPLLLAGYEVEAIPSA
jgi:3-deoxy-D-manno-octulosonic-acid transferase